MRARGGNGGGRPAAAVHSHTKTKHTQQQSKNAFIAQRLIVCRVGCWVSRVGSEGASAWGRTPAESRSGFKAREKNQSIHRS